MAGGLVAEVSSHGHLGRWQGAHRETFVNRHGSSFLGLDEIGFVIGRWERNLKGTRDGCARGMSQHSPYSWATATVPRLRQNSDGQPKTSVPRSATLRVSTTSGGAVSL